MVMCSAMNTSLLRAPRFPLRMPLQYQKSGVSHWFEGKTLNISRTGILFHADESVPKDATLDIRVEFPGKVTFSCQGSVVRTENSAFAVRIHRYNLCRA
jgi:hypothetical protein